MSWEDKFNTYMYLHKITEKNTTGLISDEKAERIIHVLQTQVFNEKILQKIRKMVDANYAKTVQNTMRKYNKKVSRGNDSIVKGSFVTVRIPTVDRASRDLSSLLCKVVDGSLFKLACLYGILNLLYDMGDLELLNSVVDIFHWVETPISLHAAANQASFSLSCKRCKCEGNCDAKSYNCRKTEVPERNLTTTKMMSIFPLGTFHLYVAAFQKHMYMEFISLSLYDFSELVVLIRISLIERC